MQKPFTTRKLRYILFRLCEVHLHIKLWDLIHWTQFTDILRYFQALHIDMDVMDLITGDALSVTEHIVFHIRKSARHIDTALSSAIKAAVESTAPLMSADSPVVQIPYTVVERILVKEIQTEASSRATIVVLNPTSPGLAYSYSYPGGCASVVWACRSRFVWVDLQAGRQILSDVQRHRRVSITRMGLE